MKKATKLFALLIIVSTAMSTLASCGVAENIFGEKHTHKYGEWIKKLTPTCTDSGEWIRYCECGEKQTENFPAIGHSFENGVCKNCAQNDPSYKVEDKDDNKTDDSKDDEVNEAVRIIVPKNLKEGTFGYAHWTIFKDAMIEGIASSPIEVANVIVNSGIIPFTAEATKVEVENKYFTGFDYYTIEGYKSCATFIPTMASTAYVGYIFELEDGVDIYGFIDDLSTNANPLWTLCFRADEILVGAYENTVFFFMCDSSFVEEDNGGDVNVKPTGDFYYPITLEEGTFGYAHWTIFEDEMVKGTATSPIEIANAIVESGIIPFMAGVMEIEVGTEYFTGFDNYTIEGYESAAVFMPMMGSIPYVGYIFELEDGVDVYNFIDDLAENCNPRWNICVEADETLIGACGNTVFFLMCPISIE